MHSDMRNHSGMDSTRRNFRIVSGREDLLLVSTLKAPDSLPHPTERFKVAIKGRLQKQVSSKVRS